MKKDDGKVFMCGEVNYGRLGIESNSRYITKFKQVKALEKENIIDISCGGYHTGVLTRNGKVFLVIIFFLKFIFLVWTWWIWTNGKWYSIL